MALEAVDGLVKERRYLSALTVRYGSSLGTWKRKYDLPE